VPQGIDPVLIIELKHQAGIIPVNIQLWEKDPFLKAVERLSPAPFDQSIIQVPRSVADITLRGILLFHNLPAFLIKIGFEPHVFFFHGIADPEESLFPERVVVLDIIDRQEIEKAEKKSGQKETPLFGEKRRTQRKKKKKDDPCGRVQEKIEKSDDEKGRCEKTKALSFHLYLPVQSLPRPQIPQDTPGL